MLAKLGQSGLSTEYCLKWNAVTSGQGWLKWARERVLAILDTNTECRLKWAEYQCWPCLAKLGRLKVVTNVGQSGQVQNIA